MDTAFVVGMLIVPQPIRLGCLQVAHGFEMFVNLLEDPKDPGPEFRLLPSLRGELLEHV